MDKKMLIPTVGGFAVLALPGVEEQFVRAMAGAAKLSHGHPAVRDPSPEIVALCTAVWTRLRIVGGEWASPEAVTSRINHYGLAGHMEAVGALVLTPDEVAAYQAIERDPHIGEVQVLANARWGAEAPSLETLRSLLESGMGSASVHEAGLAAVDDGGMQGVELVGEVRPGRMTVARYALHLAGQPGRP